MEALPGLWSLTPIGALLGAIVLLYWLLVTGRIVPKSTHERELATQKIRGDEWKETALEYQKANVVIREQNTNLIHELKVVEQLLRAAGPNLGDTMQGGGM